MLPLLVATPASTTTVMIRESVAVKMMMIVTPCAPGRISL
jgi:hypothetical protein